MPFKQCSTHDDFAQELRNFRGYIRPEDFKAAVLSALVLGIDLTEPFGYEGSVVRDWATGKVVPKSLMRSRVILFLKERMVPQATAVSS